MSDLDATENLTLLVDLPLQLLLDFLFAIEICQNSHAESPSNYTYQLITKHQFQFIALLFKSKYLN